MEHIKLLAFFCSFTHVLAEKIIRRNDPSKGFPTLTTFSKETVRILESRQSHVKKKKKWTVAG